MRVVVLGGTRFIGRRIVADLLARGDDVLVVHRGESEPPDLASARHLHVDRAALPTVADQVRAFKPDAVIDSYAMSRSDVDSVLPHLPDVPIVVLSSVNVYEAFRLVLLGGREGEPVPLSETARLRGERLRYSDGTLRPDQEKVDVESSYLERGATVLRLPMVYGEHDHQRREEFILRRVRAGRRRIPIGAGTWLWTRAYVGDVSAAALACLTNPAVRGEVLNIGEPTVRTIRGWAGDILAAAGHEAELLPVPDPTVPEDLWLTRSIDQHVLVDCGKAVRLLNLPLGTRAHDPGLGWHPDPAAGLARSVAWHLANPPADASDDFTADDAAL